MMMTASISHSEFSNIMEAFSVKENAPVAIAVSGGSDSMCLLLLLKYWCEQEQHPLTALTVNHGLRKQAAKEAEQVKIWCDAFNIEHHILTWHGNAPTSNIQAQARTIRYNLLQDYCQQHHIAHLFLAHHQMDQAETILLRLLRGSGASGLAGMQMQSYLHNITLLRPLLNIPKERILHTLKSDNQPFIDDPSNENERFLRVNIRQFLDQLDRKDEIIHHITKSGEHMRRLDDFVMEQVLQREAETVCVHPFGFSNIDKQRFLELHPEIALRILSRQLMLVSGKKELVRFEELENLYASIKKGSPSSLTLHGCLIKHGMTNHHKHQLFIIREPNALPEDKPINELSLFDERFAWQWPSFKDESSQFSLGALGADGWRFVRNTVSVEKLPKEIFYGLPALKHLEKVVAVPHISFLADRTAADFSVRFLID